MKKSAHNWIVTFLFFLTTFAHAQDAENEEVGFNTDQDKFITLLQINEGTTQNQGNLSAGIAQGVNTVFIRQIGANNSVISSITSESSDISIIQNGNQNIVEIEENSREIEKVITQLGDNNLIRDFSFDPNQSTNLELIQEGSNLIFERFGTNELSRSLKFKMTGDSKTIVLRSF